tara:strand:- start:406 stop:693 length:288 start_codon:yes stop_codon:yes gene_type:complete
MDNTYIPEWVNTSTAEKILSINNQTLKRKRDVYPNGFLVNGVHWRYGATHSSSIQWNHKLIAQEFNYRGLKRNEYIKEQLKSAKDAKRISDLIGA